MTEKRRSAVITVIALLCLIALACERRQAPVPSPLEAPPVDSARVNAADVMNWRHQRVGQTDLNGDGRPERLVLASDVQLGPDATPLWEDGHRWAVIVDDNSQFTLLYGAFVPNGHVEAAVLALDSNRRSHVLVQERTPYQSRSLVVSYEKPGVAKTVSSADYQVEQWLPSLTNR